MADLQDFEFNIHRKVLELLSTQYSFILRKDVKEAGCFFGAAWLFKFLSLKLMFSRPCVRRRRTKTKRRRRTVCHALPMPFCRNLPPERNQ